jgi:hypothetical protein
MLAILFLTALAYATNAQTTVAQRQNKKSVQKKLFETISSSNPNVCPKGNEIIVVKASEADKPLKIISKPRAPWTDEGARAAHIQGSVRLKVTFLNCGKIGKIVPVSRLPYGLTESAVKAAKKIVFEPAMKNSKPITVAKIVEYNFSLH